MVKIPHFAYQNVLRQYCHISILRIQQKLKKTELISFDSTEKKLTCNVNQLKFFFFHFQKDSIGQKKLRLNICILLRNI